MVARLKRLIRLLEPDRCGDDSATKVLTRGVMAQADLHQTTGVLQTPAEILQYRNLWTYWPGSRDSDLDFFLYIADARPEVLHPHVLVAYRGNTPEAMLIGRMEERQVPIKFGYLSFPAPRMRVLNFVDGGLRGNASSEIIDLLVRDVLKLLRRGDVDLAIFENLQVDSCLYHAVRAFPKMFERGFPPEHRTHRCLRLPENSDALYKMLPPKQRQNYRRKGRKLVSDFSGDVHIVCYRDYAQLDLVFREVEAIAERTYQRGLGIGFQNTPEMSGRWELAASKGWLRVYILYVAGKPCAYWCATAYCGILWGDFMGYDPKYAAYSPGMYLLLCSISELCDHRADHNITQIDFGLGDAEYKSLLSDHSFQEGSVYIYGRTLRGVGVKLFSTPVLLADRSSKKILARVELLAKAKRLWRRHSISASDPPLEPPTETIP